MQELRERQLQIVHLMLDPFRSGTPYSRKIHKYLKILPFRAQE
jgi:hypothetical protein